MLEVWVVAFLRADGSHAGRYEYFHSAQRAEDYVARCARNGIRNLKVILLKECTY